MLSSNFVRQGIADSVVSLVKAQMIEAKKESLSRLNGPWASNTSMRGPGK